MINAIYEALFCPVHGLFRPDNLAALFAIGQQGLLSVSMMFHRTRNWFGV